MHGADGAHEVSGHSSAFCASAIVQELAGTVQAGHDGLSSSEISSRQVKGAVDKAKSSTGLGGVIEGLKDKINDKAITDESPAKNITEVRSVAVTCNAVLEEHQHETLLITKSQTGAKLKPSM